MSRGNENFLINSSSLRLFLLPPYKRRWIKEITTPWTLSKFEWYSHCYEAIYPDRIFNFKVISDSFDYGKQAIISIGKGRPQHLVPAFLHLNDRYEPNIPPQKRCCLNKVGKTITYVDLIDANQKHSVLTSPLTSVQKWFCFTDYEYLIIP